MVSVSVWDAARHGLGGMLKPDQSDQIASKPDLIVTALSLCLGMSWLTWLKLACNNIVSIR